MLHGHYKTPLAGARLKLEILEERLEKDTPREKLLESFKKVYFDIDRLALQVENSLFLADESTRAPILEQLSLKSEVELVAKHFPLLTVSVEKDTALFIDRRIIHAVLNNIFQNASVHGNADTIKVSVDKSQNFISLIFCDNGKGFTGDRSKLSLLFERHYQGSGSGVGLYLIRNLIERLHGKVSFPNVTNGFAVEVVVPCQQ